MSDIIRNPDTGNEYRNDNNRSFNELISNQDNQSINTRTTELNNPGNRGRNHINHSKRKFNLSKFDIIKLSLCGLILILLIVQISLFVKYNKSNKDNEVAIDQLKKKLNTTGLGSMIYKKELNVNLNKTS